MKNKKIIIAIMGKSGSGKDSILKKIVKKIPYLSLLLPVTTRDKRDGEIDGVEYTFTDDETFSEYIDRNYFMEHRKYSIIDPDDKDKTKVIYYGYPYPKDPVSICIYPYKVYKFVSTNPYLIFIPIYIRTEKEEDLLYRLIKRESFNESPNYKEVARRFIADQKDFPSDDVIKEEFKSGIFINSNLDKTVEEILQYIKYQIEVAYNYGVH